MICKVDGCGLKHFALEFCRKHHARFKRNGSPDSKYDKNGYSDLGGIRDDGPGRRGSLAVNIINDIKFKATRRGKSWELSHAEAFELIKASCTYCGFTPDWPKNRSGIDRVYSNTGYTTTNCVPCCFRCNSSKNNIDIEEFREHVKKMYMHMFSP